uniref:ATP synthase complex subunit 8 n=1 Tax=Deracantha onos TaxID=441219 RepID=B8PS96_DERON|nr:ATP synthase F0 subunit 8 [Deracantha onos]ABV23667.1 ATP8 [Deracantha onos]
MPQMMPMNWLVLFTMFSSALILFSISNYFIFYYTPPLYTNDTSLTMKSFNWKW